MAKETMTLAKLHSEVGRIAQEVRDVIKTVGELSDVVRQLARPDHKLLLQLLALVMSLLFALVAVHAAFRSSDLANVNSQIGRNRDEIQEVAKWQNFRLEAELKELYQRRIEEVKDLQEALWTRKGKQPKEE